MEIKFTNGWTAIYANEGKWMVYDNTEEQNVQGVSYLDSLIKRFNLVRVSK